MKSARQRIDQSIIDVEWRFDNEKSSFKIFFLKLQIFFLIIVQGIITASTLLFTSPTQSFQYLHDIHPEKGYTKSFVHHRKWKRKLQFRSFTSLAVSVFLTVIINIFFVGGLPLLAASCSINSNTTVDSTYISNNSCRAINITGDATVTFSGPINLQGSSAFTVDAGVTATFSGSLNLSDSNDSVVINGTVTHAVEDPVGVDIVAQTLTIGSNGSINVDSKGCRGGEGTNEKGYGPDVADSDSDGNTTECLVSQGGGGTGHTGGAGGAGHGAPGGDSGGNTAGAAGNSYGTDAGGPLLGSGGGAAEAADGGDGGGMVKLNVAGTTTINGTISADATNGTHDSNARGSGGGSGGGIKITTSTFAGSGSIDATGGTGGDKTTGLLRDGGGGSGGRIYISYTSNSFSLANITAAAGPAGANGAPAAKPGKRGGTYILDTDDDDLTISHVYFFKTVAITR